MSVELFPEAAEEGGHGRGTAVIRTSRERVGTNYTWKMNLPSRACCPGSPIVPLADAEMAVRPEGAGSDAEVRRKVGDFSRPLRDFVLSQFLRNWEKNETPGNAGHGRTCSFPDRCLA